MLEIEDQGAEEAVSGPEEWGVVEDTEDLRGRERSAPGTRANAGDPLTGIGNVSSPDVRDAAQTVVTIRGVRNRGEILEKWITVTVDQAAEIITQSALTIMGALPTLALYHVVVAGGGLVDEVVEVEEEALRVVGVLLTTGTATTMSIMTTVPDKEAVVETTTVVEMTT